MTFAEAVSAAANSFNVYMETEMDESIGWPSVEPLYREFLSDVSTAEAIGIADVKKAIRKTLARLGLSAVVVVDALFAATKGAGRPSVSIRVFKRANRGRYFPKRAVGDVVMIDIGFSSIEHANGIIEACSKALR